MTFIVDSLSFLDRELSLLGYSETEFSLIELIPESLPIESRLTLGSLDSSLNLVVTPSSVMDPDLKKAAIVCHVVRFYPSTYLEKIRLPSESVYDLVVYLSL